jgi:hypothetical protein
MRRRRFLEGCGYGLSGLLFAGWGVPLPRGLAALKAREIACDVAIIGGGLGGCAAALAALRAGRTVVLTEPTDWIGGQLTQQAVPPDEHPWVEMFGANASYQALRRGIRDYYRRHYPLTAEAATDPHLDPGNGSVSPLCHEPRVALAVLTAMLAPYASRGLLTVLLEHVPVAADVDGDRLRSVTVRDLRADEVRTDDVNRTILAPYFLDATELGDLLPLANVEHVTGFESRKDTGELHAPDVAQPDNHQSFTCCFAMEHRPGEDHTIERPRMYEFWRNYRPTLKPPWPGKLFGAASNPRQPEEGRPLEFDPTGRGKGFWVYRRILDPANFRPGSYPGSGGVTLVNWPQNDYWLGNLFAPAGGPERERAKLSSVSPLSLRPAVFRNDAADHLWRAKQLSLSLLYWLQTEAPRPDGGAGWKGLKLRPDLVGTEDGLAKYPYVRESRRIKAEFTVVEQHVGTEARRQALGREDVMAENFPDSVGVGSYRIDLHPSSGGDNYVDVSSLPFQIPLGALIPARVENLLPACKNLGVTHITNGCYRLHPVEWAIGEAAGALAAFCLDTNITPRAVRNNPARLKDFQARLTTQGVEIAWPRLTPR